MSICTQELPRFIKDLLSLPPKRGEGLHRWLFKVARVLHPYREPGEITAILEAVTFGQHLKPGEITDAVRNSASVAWKPGQLFLYKKESAWPKINQEKRDAIINGGDGLVELWESSPVRFEDSRSHTEEIIENLFPCNPLLCCGESESQFATRAHSHWRGRLAELQLIVPSPMTSIEGVTKDKRKSQHTLSNTGPRHYLVIEQDHGSEDEQAAILLDLAKKAPLALAVHSGSKSIHGWFYCKGQNEEHLRIFMRHAVSFGADPTTWTRSQFVRMPDGMRSNKRKQTAYFFNPEAIK